MLASELNYEKSSVFALFENNSLIGYVFSRLIAGKLHIVNLAVHQEQRRKGHGMTLLRFICEYGKDQGCEVCFLEVRTTNLAAIRLYQKAGFGIIRRCDCYYEDGSDAYVMGAIIEDALEALR